MNSLNNLQRKNHLSLHKIHLKTKRNDGEQQSPLKYTQNANTTAASKSPCKKKEMLRQSLSVICESSDDCAVHSTPPRQKRTVNLDDSLEYSPQYENNFSPSFLMSQTVTIESPEIGWKWNCSNNDENIAKVQSLCPLSSVQTTTPACLVSSNERRDLRNRQRKKFELQLRRKQRMETEKKLQERCAKLKEQLKMNNEVKCSNTFNISPTRTIVTNGKELKSKSTNYFDDSISDDVLLAATQEIEAQLYMSPKSSTIPKTSSNNTSQNCELPKKSTSNTKQKSALTSKFFVDEDGTDDWMFELDESSFQSKPKTPLQRYKSLPVNSRNINNELTDVDLINDKFAKAEKVTNSLSVKKWKRHISTS